MKIAIVCDSEAAGGCRAIHEPEDVQAWLRAALAARLGPMNRRSSVLTHLDEAFAELIQEMRERSRRVH